MERYVIPFEEIGTRDVALVGGKGANLGELVRAGFRVPAGAVVSTDAYRLFMQENGIDEGALAALADGAARLREAILAGHVPGELRTQLAAFYATLDPDARVAVRSSATAEDLDDASFAGQQETYLNVFGEDELLEALLHCYASLWGDRAVSYRREQGYAGREVALAVVVQRMVESESAGVAFTRNPAGDANEVLVNASWGLGEAVVSGTVSPDEYVCGRDGSLLRASVGNKERQVVASVQGTETVPVGDALRHARVLDDAALAELVRTTLAIEAHYGKPMDIEWAFAGGVLHILQARGITALEGAPAFSQAELDALPKAKPAKGRARESVLFNLEKLPRPFFPLDHDFGGAVGLQKGVLFGEVGLSMPEIYAIDDDGISYPSFDMGGLRLTRDVVHLPGLVREMLDEDHSTAAAATSLRACTERLARERELHCEGLAELGESLERMRQLICDTAYRRFRYAMFPQILENRLLDGALKKVDPTLDGFDLMDGLPYVTADINRELAHVAQAIGREPELAQAAMTLPYAELVANYPQVDELLRGFLTRFGNKANFNCYCFDSTSWNEDPDRLLHTLRTMLRSGDASALDLEQGQRDFDALMARAQRALGPRRYGKFAHRVAAVRSYHATREASQYLWESEFAHCRTLLRRVAPLLGARYGELLYLFAEELRDACHRGGLSEKDHARIARRRAKRPLAEAYWNTYMVDALATEGDGIAGVSGSPGQATGPVCLVSGPEEFAKLQRGDVLVCTATDPEWTPLFTLAAAVVVDTGGTLSHAAIVAREYGLPAVLACGNATACLRDGELVLVDGTCGTVTPVA